MFRNILLLTAVGFLASEVKSQDFGVTIDQLRGKWQESARQNISGKRVGFTDTLQLNFNKRDSVVLRDGSGVSFDGAAAVNGRELEVAGVTFTIESFSKNKLVLKDSINRRILNRRKLFYHETLGTKILPAEDLSDPIKINTSRLKGKWHVYRTQTFSGVAHDSVYIRTLEVTKSDDGNLWGEVVFQQGEKTSTEKFIAAIKDGGLHIKAETHSWDVKFYKATGNEIIFGNHGGLVYFARPK